MKFSLTLWSIFFITLSQTFSQTNQEKINLALSDYIEGFYEGDTLKLIRSISLNVVKYGYWKDKKTNKYDGESMSYKQMIDYARDVKVKNQQAKAGSVRKLDTFEIQDQTASAKVTAWWGTDYILLEKVNDKWMIRMVLWQGPLNK